MNSDGLSLIKNIFCRCLFPQIENIQLYEIGNLDHDDFLNFQDLPRFKSLNFSYNEVKSKGVILDVISFYAK